MEKMNRFPYLMLALSLLVLLSCNMLTPGTPTPDLLATLQASTPLAQTQQAIPGPLTPAFPTPVFPTPGGGGTPNPAGGPGGKIVFTCQIFKVQAMNQVCIMNADGSGFRRLTTDDNRQHFYPSLSPDGASVVYASFREANVYEIYEMKLADGSVKQLTDRLGVLNAPEISPDGTQIVFMHWIAATDRYEVWIMGRDGKNPQRLLNVTGWDPTWSPDAKQILFASNRSGPNELWVANLDGSGLQQISKLPELRGRSDWSSDGQHIVTYSGGTWAHEVYLMNADGSDAHQISKPGGNAQGAAFSPDGQWVAFTAYYDKMDDIHGCEIYIMRLDRSDMRRLTNNDYCDYQPRWGP
jgi:Tol biopolymer transport system component